MEITKDEKNLIIKVPLKQDVFDYFGEEVIGTADNLIGLIEGDDFGFANQIDMSYKDKAPQWSPIFLHIWQGTADDFKSLCKKLGIDIYEYPLCSKCGEPIYGACTWKDGGEVCFKCDRS